MDLLAYSRVGTSKRRFGSGLAVSVGLTFYGLLKPVPQKVAPKKHAAHYTAHVQTAVHHVKHRQEPLSVERLAPLKQIAYHEPNIAVLAIMEPESVLLRR